MSQQFLNAKGQRLVTHVPTFIILYQMGYQNEVNPSCPRLGSA